MKHAQRERCLLSANLPYRVSALVHLLDRTAFDFDILIVVAPLQPFLSCLLSHYLSSSLASSVDLSRKHTSPKRAGATIINLERDRGKEQCKAPHHSRHARFFFWCLVLFIFHCISPDKLANVTVRAVLTEGHLPQREEEKGTPS